MIRRAFYSKSSFNDAIIQAKMQGFTPIQQVYNQKGQYVVFARK